MARQRTPRHRGSKKAIEKAERRAEVVELRKAGHTLAEIASMCGYADPSGVHRAIVEACKLMPAAGLAGLRAHEGAKLDALEAACWPEAMAGSKDHVQAAIAVAKRRASLLGLDAPEKYDATIRHELPDDPAALKMRLLTVLEGLHANATAPDTGTVDGAGGPAADPGDVDPNKPKL